ncbi:hypothetical protein Y1Q_0019185 [Alligator mississippiensis]|uniref:Uncharacterized protein n=1 Tax=Alligator mississippiensis TaxID=8496 RepID=A0A151MQA3_ALLMI|nr:hypothetical protein Y1Q_0019185 [Alligator mississippiensis]
MQVKCPLKPHAACLPDELWFNIYLRNAGKHQTHSAIGLEETSSVDDTITTENTHSTQDFKRDVMKVTRKLTSWHNGQLKGHKNYSALKVKS